MENKIIIVLLLVAIMGWGSLMIKGVDKHEVVECLKWQEQAEIYPNFYLTEWQKMQCDYHEITIEAPVY